MYHVFGFSSSTNSAFFVFFLLKRTLLRFSDNLFGVFFHFYRGQQLFFALSVFIWNFVHVLLKPSNISLACDRQYSRHLCRGTEHLLQTHHFTAFPGKSRLSTFWQDSFLVLWVLFPLEYVLLFYLIVNKVDLWRGLFFKWEISWYVISYSFTVINLCL